MKDFNYQEQLLLWKKNQLLLQKKYADTPPGFPSEEAATAALDEWEKEYECFLEDRRFKINDTSLPSVPSPLVGREEELALVHSMLVSFHTAILYGIGGIGKTSIALAYIDRYRHSYNHVLYAVTDKGILEAICDDAAIPISGLQYSRKQYPAQRQYFRAKLDALQKISETEKILIVIDNINTPADKNLRQFLSLSCDKILTTRRNYDLVPNEEKLPVSALCPERWPELIGAYYNGAEQSKIKQLLEYGYQVQGHTLSIKMAAVQATHRELFEKPNQNVYLASLLSAFRLKEAERRALLYLSVLAPQGMEKELFLQVSGASEHTLQSLCSYLLIDVLPCGNTSAPGTLLRMHPLIAEAIRQIMPPTYINCSRLLRGFEKYLYGDDLGIGTWNRTYEENRLLEPHIFALYRTFPEPAPWLATAFEEIVTFLWVQGYFAEALPYAIKIYESIINYYGPGHVLAGREALRVAAVYHNHMDHEQALIWYLKGYELLKGVEPRTLEVTRQLSNACEKLAREYSHRKDSEAFSKYWNENVLLVNDLIQSIEENFSTLQKQIVSIKKHYFLLEGAKHALRSGRIDDARELYKPIEKWMKGQKNLGYRESSFKEVYIEILIHTNELEEAEKTARENVSSALLYRGEKYKDYLTRLETLADVLVLKKETAEAFSIYETVLTRLQRDCPDDEEWSGRIMDKMAGLSTKDSI